MAAKKGDQKIIDEMHGHKSECKEVFTSLHAVFKADKRFMLARDGQWTSAEETNLGANRTQTNRMKAYLFQILNAFIRQDIGCDVAPSSEGASLKLAQVRQAQVMKLWDLCNGREMLADACKDQLSGGFGVMGMRLKYADNETFNQILQFFAVLDCTKFYWDLTATEPGYADMGWCLHEEKISKKTYEKRYGDWAEISDKDEKTKWEDDNKKRVFEYWRVRQVNKRTVYLLLDSNQTIEKKEYDELVKAHQMASAESEKSFGEEQVMPSPPPEVAVDEDGNPRSRVVYDGRAEQFIIANDKIIKRSVWPIGRIPFKVVPGRKYVEDDKLFLQSMGMDAQSPQRKYNFIETQKNLLYSKGPTEIVFVPAGAAMEGLVNKLQEASRNGGRNVAVIPFVTHDEEGNLLPAPVFKPPLLGDPFLTQEAEAAIRDIEATFGMIQEGWLNRNSSASGVAIRNSEMQAQNSMFDYPDAAISALQEYFRDVMEILPKISMPMQVKLAGDSMKEQVIWVNNAKLAGSLHQESVELDEDEKYSLTVKARPSADTMRQKSFEEMDAFAKRHPGMADYIADLDAKDSLTALHAEEISKRMHRIIAQKDPSLFEDIDPTSEALRMQLQQTQQALQQLQTQMVALDKEATDHIAKLEIQLTAAREDNTNEAEKIRLQGLIDAEKIRQGWAKLRLEEMKAQQAAMARVLSPAAGLAKDAGAQEPSA